MHPTGLFRGHHEVVVGKVIIVTNVVALVLMVATGSDLASPGGWLFERGALFGPLVVEGEWWRLITSGFLHAGVLHLGSNMLLLWFLAQEMEEPLGRVQFSLVYVMSIVGGSLGQIVLSPLTAALGASGGIFGLMGALIALQIRTRRNPWSSGIIGLVLLNLLLTFTIPGISVGGHVGGLLVGVAGGALAEPVIWNRPNRREREVLLGAMTIGLAALAVLAAHWVVPGALESRLLGR